MKPYYEDAGITLYHGQALDVLRTLPDGSVDCCVTSPPYFGLRDYGIEGQIGAEASPVEFVAALVAVFAEVRRVLADDGTLWLNLGDSYYSGRGAATGKDKKNSARRFGVRALDKGGQEWGTPKGLLMIPARSAIALQDDGWILRSDVIWVKPNPMPEAVKDRPTSSHEHVFMLTKSRRYFYDADAIAETATGQASGNGFARPESIAVQSGAGRNAPDVQALADEAKAALGGYYREFLTGGTRNRRDVWTIPTEGFPEAHFATFPRALPHMCIAAGCKPGGTVLDPFSGSGTTGLAAGQLGHPYVGIDLNADYLDLSLRTRLAQAAITDGGAA